MIRNADGSLDLLVQADPPPLEQRAHWLPVHTSAPFQLTLRLYRASAAALNGLWAPPPLQRVD